jgi:hypothetical protein
METSLKKALTNWEKCTLALARAFVKHYFGNPQDYDWYFISDEIGSVLVINDYFFGMTDIVDYIQYKYSEKDMFDHHDTMLKNAEKGMSIDANIKNWRELRKKK